MFSYKKASWDDYIFGYGIFRWKIKNDKKQEDE